MRPHELAPRHAPARAGRSETYRPQPCAHCCGRHHDAETLQLADDALIWGLSWYWNRGQEEIRLRRAIERAIEGQPNVGPVRTVDPSQPEELTIELGETPIWVVPYEVVTPGRPRTDAAIHKGAAQGDLQRMILEVVSGEGPVAAEVVLQRVREQWGLNRAGSRARGAFDTALRAIRRRGEIVSESDGFLVDFREIALAHPLG
jgi:hypothetical protein